MDDGNNFRRFIFKWPNSPISKFEILLRATLNKAGKFDQSPATKDVLCCPVVQSLPFQ